MLERHPAHLRGQRDAHGGHRLRALPQHARPAVLRQRHLLRPPRRRGRVQRRDHDASHTGHDGTFYVAVQDNGERDGAAAHDRFRVPDYTFYFQGGCTNWEQAVFPAEVSQGNIQVLR